MVWGVIAPGDERKGLGLRLGFKGGVRVELGGVRVVVAFIKSHLLNQCNKKTLR